MKFSKTLTWGVLAAGYNKSYKVYCVDSEYSVSLLDTLNEAKEVGEACSGEAYVLIEEAALDDVEVVVSEQGAVIDIDVNGLSFDVSNVDYYRLTLVSRLGDTLGEPTEDSDLDYCSLSYMGTQMRATIDGTVASSPDTNGLYITITYTAHDLPTFGVVSEGFVLTCTEGLGGVADGIKLEALATATVTVQIGTTEAPAHTESQTDTTAGETTATETATTVGETSA